MLSVGILGAGFMGTVHAAGWLHTPARIAGIYALDTGSASKLTQQFDLPRQYDSYDAMLADPEVDVVDICTPTYLHHQHVLQAAAAGKHIICEKPLALTVEQAQEMIEACEQAGVQLFAAQVVRFFPEYASAKAIVDRGDIGNVAVVRLTRCSFQPRRLTENWFLDSSKSGGMMLDLMIHDFDYARWVAGEVESVYARSLRSQTPTAPTDYSLVVLRHRNGAISNIEGGWAYPPPLFRTALEIAGDAGLIEHPAGSSTPLGVHLHPAQTEDGPNVGRPLSPLLEDPYAMQLRHFYEVLTDASVTPRVTARDGLKAVQIALAAIQSAQLGQPVQL